eukprot:2789287-Pleurochrysis_carterae.AAC.2
MLGFLREYSKFKETGALVVLAYRATCSCFEIVRESIAAVEDFVSAPDDEIARAHSPASAPIAPASCWLHASAAKMQKDAVSSA